MEQTAIVIGGTRRIGRWVSEALCVQETRVHAVYARDDASARNCRAELAQAGFDLAVHRTDATDAEAVRGTIESIATDAGGLHILVNCAGRGASGPLLTTGPEELEVVWRSNMLSVHHTVTAAAQYLKLSRGRIINFLSIGADSARAFRQVPAYAAAKAMLASYSRSLARELAPAGVTVNCIALGITELPPEGVPGQDPAELPTGRAVAQEDLAAALWYLTGPASGQVTGTVVNLSGGWAL